MCMLAHVCCLCSVFHTNHHSSSGEVRQQEANGGGGGRGRSPVVFSDYNVVNSQKKKSPATGRSERGAASRRKEERKVKLRRCGVEVMCPASSASPTVNLTLFYLTAMVRLTFPAKKNKHSHTKRSCPPPPKKKTKNSRKMTWRPVSTHNTTKLHCVEWVCVLFCCFACAQIFFLQQRSRQSVAVSPGEVVRWKGGRRSERTSIKWARRGEEKGQRQSRR